MRRYLYGVVTGEKKGFAAFLVQAVLLGLSFFYGAGVRIKRWCYDKGLCRAAALGRPVISVGNVTWGGVGKTPLVQAVAEHLKGRGIKPAILTRGYMPDGKDAGSDEAVMLAAVLPDVPVGVGADRIKTAAGLLAKHPVDLFLLDDGFQHWHVKRDLDLVAVDAVNPWGNGRLIPAGMLREPLSSLKRADVIVLTKTDQAPQNISELKSRLRRMNSHAPVIETVHNPCSVVALGGGQQKDAAFLSGKKIAAFCSVGDPEGFKNTLATVGADVRKIFAFPDHHAYTGKDISDITAYAAARSLDAVVTTAKDAVKLTPFRSTLQKTPCWVLHVKIKIVAGQDEFYRRIDRLLSR